MATEKYANPGLYLDEDDHARLLDENREAYIREDAQRVQEKIRSVETAMDCVESQTAYDALTDEKDALEERLAELQDKLEWYE